MTEPLIELDKLKQIDLDSVPPEVLNLITLPVMQWWDWFGSENLSKEQVEKALIATLDFLTQNKVPLGDAFGREILFVATDYRLVNVCRTCFENGIEVHGPFENEVECYESPLVDAVSSKDLEFLSVLLEGCSKETLDMPDSTWGPPLTHAVNLGFADGVRLLINAGANVNGVFGGIDDLPIMVATKRGDLAIITMLLDAGADPNIMSWNGLTTLELVNELPVDEKSRGIRALFRFRFRNYEHPSE